MVLRSLALSPQGPSRSCPSDLFITWSLLHHLFFQISLTILSHVASISLPGYSFQQVSRSVVSTGPEFHICSIKTFLYVVVFLESRSKPRSLIVNFSTHLQPWKMNINPTPIFLFSLLHIYTICFMCICLQSCFTYTLLMSFLMLPFFFPLKFALSLPCFLGFMQWFISISTFLLLGFLVQR